MNAQSKIRALAATAFLAASALVPTAGVHADAPALSPHVTEQFALLQNLVEKKAFPELLRQIDLLLPTTDPESYDRALLSQVRSQVLLSFDPPRYADAIPPLETAILLGDTHGYFDAATLLDSLGTLSQLYYELSAATKDIAVRRANLRQAYTRIERWLESSRAATAAASETAADGAPKSVASIAQTIAPKTASKNPAPAGETVESETAAGERDVSKSEKSSDSAASANSRSAAVAAAAKKPKPRPAPPRPPAALLTQTATASLYAATLLYTEATLDPNAPADAALLRRALAHVRESLNLRPALDDPSLVLQLAIHQLLNQHPEAAEILELLVLRAPENAVYWQQLTALYAAIAAQNESAPSANRARRARALNAYSRAIQAGHRLSAMEQYNRVALLTILRQYGDAIRELEIGLSAKTIENTRENWELLANLLQQEGHSARAAALFEKTKAAAPNPRKL